MLLFFLYTLLALLANASLVKIAHISIQDGQWLDSLLHWQKRLQQWDMDGKVFLAKAGGYCEVCFSHLLTFAGFWVYVFFMHTAIGVWVTDSMHNLLLSAVVNVVWYLVYIGVGTNLSLYFIAKLFQK